MTRAEKLADLRRQFAACQDRILELSQMRGRDHTDLARMLAREIANRQLIRDRILALQEQCS